MNDETMFCRQCQETFGNTGCTRGGVCGKKPATAALMDELVSGLEELAAERKPTRELGRFVTEALFLTLTNANFDDARLTVARAECRRFLGRPIARKKPRAFADADADVRSLKELTLFGLKGISAYAHHAQVLGHEDDAIYAFLFKALKAMTDCHDTGYLTDLVLECGRTAVAAMALLDAANTSAFGKPRATEVDLGVGTKPGILVSGHDLKDLEELLEQTKDAGVDVYTHGEMLPAHYYTQVAEGLPHDAVILTAGCAKYRYIKTVKGDIDGIPRVLDAGQCNDAYSLAMIAMMLRDALGTDDLNRLPLVFDIAWYEQKAVAVLLALLALGFRDIRLGPTLPAFLSPGVKNVLVSRFGLKGITSAADDVREMMR